jgi:Cu(I)/Ag(I) efflux system membrane fusion protein
MSGIVIHKNGFEGLYVNTGTRIYTIADLSRVWVRLDAYESDLVWIRYGQEVEFTTEAYPGDVFTGKIAFIDPVLNAKTRTVKVRVNVSNPDGKLKPEMFVRAVVRAKVASGGKVMDAVLAGKWVCPMHPDVVEDEPGFCSVCEMPLVRPESLGYVTVDPAGMSAPLVVPVSAPLITGTRAVVYVAVPGKESVYEGREVVLGPRAGDYYLVRDGLEEGEMVVGNGTFKIDSALQILAKPSMMSPEGGAPPPGHDHGAMPGMAGEEVTEQADVSSFTDIPDEFKKLLDPVVAAYFEIQQALSRDNLQAARSGTKKIVGALGAVDMGLLDGPAHMAWMRESDNLKKSVDVMAGADDIEQTRSGFLLLSESMAAVAKQFGTAGVRPVLRFHCPMAFNGRGADWLQNKPETENPYFGAAMFKCGQQTEVIVEGPSS